MQCVLADTSLSSTVIKVCFHNRMSLLETCAYHQACPPWTHTHTQHWVAIAINGGSLEPSYYWWSPFPSLSNHAFAFTTQHKNISHRNNVNRKKGLKMACVHKQCCYSRHCTASNGESWQSLHAQHSNTFTSYNLGYTIKVWPLKFNTK